MATRKAPATNPPSLSRPPDLSPRDTAFDRYGARDPDTHVALDDLVDDDRNFVGHLVLLLVLALGLLLVVLFILVIIFVPLLLQHGLGNDGIRPAHRELLDPATGPEEPERWAQELEREGQAAFVRSHLFRQLPGSADHSLPSRRRRLDTLTTDTLTDDSLIDESKVPEAR